jgi:acid phosphatase type 7
VREHSRDDRTHRTGEDTGRGAADRVGEPDTAPVGGSVDVAVERHAGREPTPTPTLDPVVTLSGAGDIARCDGRGDEATARLLDALPGWVFTAGDNAYPDGRARDFRRCYAPSWGRHRDRTFPVLGNHEWRTRGASGYFDYFGERAGERGDGWYAVDLGSWRVIVLVSDCDQVGGCGPRSRQGRWLAAELASNPRTCSLAIWHHPRYSSGIHGPTVAVAPFWRALHAAGVELVVNGHEHSYERFVRLDPRGRRDPEHGIRQFVVGTGGGTLRAFRRITPGSHVRIALTYGVLRLDLGPGRYDWSFLPVGGGDPLDEGSAACH